QHSCFRQRAPLEQCFQAGTTRHTSQCLVILASERQSFFLCHALPRAIVKFSGISQHAVQVKNVPNLHYVVDPCDMVNGTNSPLYWTLKRISRQWVGSAGLICGPCGVSSRPQKPKTSACHTPPHDAAWMPSRTLPL